MRVAANDDVDPARDWIELQRVEACGDTAVLWYALGPGERHAR